MKTITGKQFYDLPEGTVFRTHGLIEPWRIKGPTEGVDSAYCRIHWVADIDIPATPADMKYNAFVKPKDVIYILEPEEIDKVARFWNAIRKIHPLPMTQSIGTPEKPKYEHIDDLLNNSYDVISDPALRYAYWFFTIHRFPAHVQAVISPFVKDIKLFVDYEGKTWRVTGASHLGDIWLTSDFNKNMGYDKRVTPDTTKLTGWRATPSKGSE